jgi:hypothetical protein
MASLAAGKNATLRISAYVNRPEKMALEEPSRTDAEPRQRVLVNQWIEAAFAESQAMEGRSDPHLLQVATFAHMPGNAAIRDDRTHSG